jgi:rhodanese-related sulfurtransferase
MKTKVIFLMTSLVLFSVLLVFFLTKAGDSAVAGGSEVLRTEQESFQLISGGPGVFAETGDLTAAEFQKLRNAGREFVVIDVREPDEFAGGRIPGAKNIPLGKLAGRLGEIPKDKDVVLVCRSGRRSGMALDTLKANGYTKAHNLLGGMNGWDGSVDR